MKKFTPHANLKIVYYIQNRGNIPFKGTRFARRGLPVKLPPHAEITEIEFYPEPMTEFVPSLYEMEKPHFIQACTFSQMWDICSHQVSDYIPDFYEHVEMKFLPRNG